MPTNLRSSQFFDIAQAFVTNPLVNNVQEDELSKTLNIVDATLLHNCAAESKLSRDITQVNANDKGHLLRKKTLRLPYMYMYM